MKRYLFFILIVTALVAMNACEDKKDNNGLPKVITDTLRSITYTSAVCGGNVTDEGDSPVIARGICWKASGVPSVIDNHTNDGIGAGVFTSTISGLNPFTKYYVRAFAANDEGVAYGNVDTFTTGAYSTITDIDGNVYHTIIIGTQTWLLEDLKTTHYRNGDSIPNVTNNETWSTLTTGAYSNYDNNATTAATYGRLYNWYAVNDSRGLAPVGWHIPSETEWKTLENFLGGWYVAGGSLKETGTTHWLSPNTGATNVTGFTAIPGGHRDHTTGAFGYLGAKSDWWMSTETTVDDAWHHSVGYDYNHIGYSDDNKKYGLSVRCIKD